MQAVTGGPAPSAFTDARIARRAAGDYLNGELETVRTLTYPPSDAELGARVAAL